MNKLCTKNYLYIPKQQYCKTQILLPQILAPDVTRAFQSSVMLRTGGKERPIVSPCQTLSWLKSTYWVAMTGCSCLHDLWDDLKQKQNQVNYLNTIFLHTIYVSQNYFSLSYLKPVVEKEPVETNPLLRLGMHQYSIVPAKKRFLNLNYNTFSLYPLVCATQQVCISFYTFLFKFI